VAIRVQKIAEATGGRIEWSNRQDGRNAEVVSVLTNLEPAGDSLPESSWQIEIAIGKGFGARRLWIDLPPLLSKSSSPNDPVFLGEATTTGRCVTYFQGRFFLLERTPKDSNECEEILLRIKKAIYEEEAELTSLRAAVANLEAAIEYQRSGRKREPISEDVKLVVWARDGGACVRCGAKQNLHFDHIIPVAMGGGSTEANIQILCQTCNLKKSNKIVAG
jgi:hypothetical protein